MSACFDMASRARTRAAESYGMAVSLGQAKVNVIRFLRGKWCWLEWDLFEAGFGRFLGSD